MIIQIVVVELGKSSIITGINGNLKEMQEIVGGSIQAVYSFPEEVALIFNDEDKVHGLHLNRGAMG